ncbi:unnamed protein product, partial [Laminaria digitata]
KTTVQHLLHWEDIVAYSFSRTNSFRAARVREVLYLSNPWQTRAQTSSTYCCRLGTSTALVMSFRVSQPLGPPVLHFLLLLLTLEIFTRAACMPPLVGRCLCSSERGRSPCSFRTFLFIEVQIIQKHRHAIGHKSLPGT